MSCSASRMITIRIRLAIYLAFISIVTSCSNGAEDNTSNATSNIWTWISGNETNHLSYGSYGVKGTASASNVPGARRDAVSWVDANGNLWLFGGEGYTDAGFSGQLNDLWRWDGTNWTWISGSNIVNQSGTYGTKGVADPANVPGARRGSVSWVDSDGNLWLFGGKGVVSTNDLWKWDGTNWTWVLGADNGVVGIYGTKGIADSANQPGARYDSISWTDANGDFWLFGGIGIDSVGTKGELNDLWYWDGTNWTWVSGSNIANQLTVYGFKGVAAPTNVPGGRSAAASWIDEDGNFWLFGGAQGFWAGNADLGFLNDLWRWDGENWTWVSGSNTVLQGGIYGTKGVADPANVPGARPNAASWTDANGNLWLFGGGQGVGIRNDLWRWDGLNWTWVSGSDTLGIYGSYGIKGVPDPSNMPHPRDAAISWIDSSGNLWLFGGELYFNDLWRYHP